MQQNGELNSIESLHEKTNNLGFGPDAILRSTHKLFWEQKSQNIHPCFTFVKVRCKGILYRHVFLTHYSIHTLIDPDGIGRNMFKIFLLMTKCLNLANDMELFLSGC